MKKLVLAIIALAVMPCLSAQTYNGGVWYSLYDTQEHTMNTKGDYEKGGIFAPTAGKLNVQWKYQWIDWVGAFKKIDTGVLESANGGSSTNQVGSLAENTSNNSNTSESFNLSRNINWIKFNREGYPTHKVIVYHIDIPLAKHILFASGDYGTTEAKHEFGEVYLKDASEPYKVSLRSFLSAGDITVSSSDPDIFHIGSADNLEPLVYAVGANACASANGKADAASEGTLGKISNYDFDIVFTPKKEKEYVANITITDGVSTAKITVSGIGLKRKQTNYSYEAAICKGDTYTDENFADLSEEKQYFDTLVNMYGGDSVICLTLKLNPTYSFEESRSITAGDKEMWQNIDLSLIPAGDSTLVAEYKTLMGCDSIYNLHLTVIPRIVTYGNDTVTLCAGETITYEGKTYKRPTKDSVTLSIPNVYGGDSIIELVIRVLPIMKVKTEQTIMEGEQLTWQDIDLAELPAGDTTLIAEYTSVNGCDSVYVLNLKVIGTSTSLYNPSATELNVQKVIVNGQLYIRKGDEWFDLSGRKCRGL